MYDEEEEEQIEKIKIPKYRIVFMDLEVPKPQNDVVNSMERTNTQENEKKEPPKINYQEKILEYATVSLEGCDFDKDIATKLKRKLDEDPEMNNPSVSNAEKNIDEHGVWHVIVGRQFVASVTFDAKFLLYFIFEDLGKFFLVFRS